MPANSQETGSGSVERQERSAIQRVIEQFAEGIRSLNSILVRSAFHPRALSFSVTSHGICIEPWDAWPEILRKAEEDDSHLFREEFSVRTLAIDFVGTVAIAKVEWKFQSCRIVDFYNLLKTDSGWLITNQVYHTMPLPS